MPRARRPALPSAETSFRGKGAAACRCRPRPFQVGVFLCVLLPVPCGIAHLPSLWGKRRRGGSKPWFLPQPCLPLSSIPSPKRRQRVLGLLDSVQAHQYTRQKSHGRRLSWVYGPRDLSGGEPVRLSVRHTGPPCGVCRWRFPYAPLPWGSPRYGRPQELCHHPCGCSVVLNAWTACPPVATVQPATVWQRTHTPVSISEASQGKRGR